MKKSNYKQRGYNAYFPKVLDTWVFGENPVPEWLVDLAEVKILTGDGIINLDTRRHSDGSYDILQSGKTGVLVHVGGISWIVCHDQETGRLMGLSPEVFEILYKKEED